MVFQLCILPNLQQGRFSLENCTKYLFIRIVWERTLKSDQ